MSEHEAAVVQLLEAPVAASSQSDADGQAPQPTFEWPDPTPEMLEDPQFERIWQCIKRWDINVPAAYSGYCGATGNHVRAILDALNSEPT